MNEIGDKSILPIEATHNGPFVSKFPANDKERDLYEAAQKVLRASTFQDGFESTQYPAWLKKSTDHVYIRDLNAASDKHPKRTKSEVKESRESNCGFRQRGLFANKIFKPGEVIVPYEGIVLTMEDFEVRYPLNSEGKIIYLSGAEFKRDPDHGKDDIIILETEDTIKADMQGLTGKIVRYDEAAKKYEIKLDGFREAHHTLSLNGNVFIDAEIKPRQTNRLLNIRSCKTYVAGMGAFANSADRVFQEIFNKKQTANAAYWISPEDKKAVLVATKIILAHEEILIDSYVKGRKFKSQVELWNVLKPKPKIAKPIIKSKYNLRKNPVVRRSMRSLTSQRQTNHS